MAIGAYDITLKGVSYPFTVLDFDMELQPNTHGRARVLLRLNERPDLATELLYGSKLSIDYSTAESAMGTLFCGLLECASVERKDQYYELSITLTTGSMALDLDPKSVAFQDDAMTYSEVIDCTLAETDGAMMIIATEDDPPIDGMLIQCNETDWAFIRRLASHLEEAIFPDWLTGKPAFYFGTKLQTGETNVELTNYTTVLDKRFYEQGGFLAGFSKRDFVYYRIETDMDYAPGTRAQIDGAMRQVMCKRGKLVGGQIRFTYDWGTAYIVRRRDNEDLIGLELSGTVVETVDERVRIALDIDAVAPVIFHPWTPVTGNHFYCMPEVGTRVMLYCGSRLEESAKAMENVRENGMVQLRAEEEPEEREYHRRLLNPDNRFFASQAGKEMSMLPRSIGLGPREAPPKILVTDGIGVRIEDRTLSMKAGEAIAFQGARVQVQAPSHISVVRSGRGAISTFDICNDFNVSGTIGSLRSSSRAAMRIPKSSVVEELGPIAPFVAACIAAIPLGAPESTRARTANMLAPGRNVLEAGSRQGPNAVQEQMAGNMRGDASGSVGERAQGPVQREGSMTAPLRNMDMPREMRGMLGALATSALGAIPNGQARPSSFGAKDTATPNSGVARNNLGGGV